MVKSLCITPHLSLTSLIEKRLSMSYNTPMHSSTIETEKRKLVMSIFAGLILIFAAIYIGLSVFVLGNIDIKELKSPITYIFLGVLAFIAVAHILNKFFKYKRLVKLLPVMTSVSKELEMQYLSDETTPSAPTKQDYLRQVIGKLKGIKTGREGTIYPAIDFSRVKNKNARAVTIFQIPLGHEAPDITIEPKGAITNAMSKMMGGSIEFRENYYILTQFIGDIDEASKTKILEQTKEIFPIEAMQIYESLPKKKTLLIKNGTVIFGIDGFYYDLETYKKGLEFITKVNGDRVKML